jgi:acetyl-CoA carboxylase biotin carboxyl carrier protein
MAEKVAAHITGTVVRVEVEKGSAVSAGQVVVILESMKMELPVEALVGGTVLEIRVGAGQPVAEGDLLVILG